MSELNPFLEHELKCWPEYYDAVERGEKTFEIRKWDRPYKVGDTLLLRRYDPETQCYTGGQTRRKITYLLDLTFLPGDDRPHFAGYVVLGFSAQPANAPLTLHFGRGELGVGTAYEAPVGPTREINIRRLSAPLPIASPIGGKEKYVDELENVLVRMQFDNAESAHVLERAVRTVLAGFGSPPNVPLTLEQLREMDGEPVWIEVLDRPDLSRWHFIVRHPKIGLIAKDGLGQYECYPHNSDQMVFSGCYYDIQYGHNYGKTWLAYAHNPDRSEA